MKNIKKLLCSSIVFLILFTSSVLAVDLEVKELPYTREYEKYLELSDEEKSQVLEPRKYDVSNEYSSTKESLLANEKITFSNLVKILRAEISTSDTRFSLKDIISNNVTIKDQKSTNTCWTFASLSSLETNLALQDYYANSNTEGSTVYDYSELHMAYSKTQTYSDSDGINYYGWDWAASGGGTAIMAVSYLTDGQGAVSEDEMQFVDDDTTTVTKSSVEGIDAETTVDSIIWFDALDLTDDSVTSSDIEEMKTTIKEHIINYGSVYAGIYGGGTTNVAKYIDYYTGGIYVSTDVVDSTSSNYDKTAVANHAVSIVGWDDEYSASNFVDTPSSDGAWIIKNSWGETPEYTFEDLGITADTAATYASTYYSYYDYKIDYDEETITLYLGLSESDGGEGYGYFYVSYEDAIIYTLLMGIVDADSEVTYDNLYQLDELGCVTAYTYGEVDTYMANVFTRDTTNTEYLTKVGITNYTSGTYEVYINPDGTSKSSSDLIQATFADGNTQITLTAGYNTIEFSEAFELTGTNFTVVLKSICENGEKIYIPVESSVSGYTTTAAVSNSGESFITFDETGYFDSNNWVDIGDTTSEKYLGNLCIKALTNTSYSGTIANASTDDDSDNDSNGDDSGTGTGTDSETEAVNADYSSAEAEITYLKINISTEDLVYEMEMTIDVSNIVVEDEDETYKQYFYLSTNSALDTSSISDSNWASVDEFTKQDDGTYTISLTVDENTYLDDVDGSADDVYVYIKEIATKDTATSTLLTDGIILTAYTDGLETSTDSDGDSATATSTNGNNTNNTNGTVKTISGTDNTTATSSLPYTGIKTIVIILIIGGIAAIYTYVKYKNLRNIK